MPLTIGCPWIIRRRRSSGRSIMARSFLPPSAPAADTCPAPDPSAPYPLAGRPLHLRDPPLAGPQDDVLDDHPKGGVLGLRPYRLDLDQAAEPLLERTLDQELDRRGQLRAVRREDQLEHPAAERRPVDPLPG